MFHCSLHPSVSALCHLKKTRYHFQLSGRVYNTIFASKGKTLPSNVTRKTMMTQDSLSVLCTSQIILFLQVNNRWKITYLNCREIYEDMINHCSYMHNLIACEIKAITRKKKFRPEWGSNLRPMRYQYSALTTVLSSQLSLQFKYMIFHIVTCIVHHLQV